MQTKRKGLTERRRARHKATVQSAAAPIAERIAGRLKLREIVGELAKVDASSLNEDTGVGAVLSHCAPTPNEFVLDIVFGAGFEKIGASPTSFAMVARDLDAIRDLATALTEIADSVASRASA
jgi:hypothetical protein